MSHLLTRTSELYKAIFAVVDISTKLHQIENIQQIRSLNEPIFEQINSKTKFDKTSNIEFVLTDNVRNSLSTVHEQIEFYCMFDMINMRIQCHYVSSKPRRTICIQKQFALHYCNSDESNEIVLILSQDTRNLENEYTDSFGYQYNTSIWNDKLYAARLETENSSTNNRIFNFHLENSRNIPAKIQLNTYTDTCCFKDTTCKAQFKVSQSNQIFQNIPIPEIFVQHREIILKLHKNKKLFNVKLNSNCIGFAVIIPPYLMLGKYGLISSYDEGKNTFQIDVPYILNTNKLNIPIIYEQIECQSCELELVTPFTKKIPNISFNSLCPTTLKLLQTLDNESYKSIKTYNEQLKIFKTATKKFFSSIRSMRVKEVKMSSPYQTEITTKQERVAFKKKSKRVSWEDQILVPSDWVGKYINFSGEIKENQKGPTIGYVPAMVNFTPGWQAN